MTGLDVAAFLAELVLLAALAVAGARLGSGGWGVLLAVGLPVLLAVVWGRWLAPRAARPLAWPGPPVVKVGLSLGSAGLLGLSGLWPWAGVV
ncbi:MAG TPA: YrdB family protein, partial [Mycobacteriales bacterium]|nr:YrdB family protein [Mycobacteriales bacterium]